jgi:hypothetical protein
VKTFFGTTLLALTLVVASFLPQPKLMAQTAAEPAIVVSMASLSDQLDDVTYLTEAAGLGQMGNMARMQAEGFLRGIDKTKPIGMLLFFSGSNPQPEVLAYVPVSNLDDMLDTVSGFAVVEDGDGYSVIQPEDGPEMFVKEMGGYAVITPNKELFDGAPEDLQGFVGDMPSQYNMAAKIFAQRVPAELRAQAIEMIESSSREQLENMAEEGGMAADLQKKNFEMQMQQVKSLINETDELVIGLDFDKGNKNIHFDARLVGLDGSLLAKQSRNYASDTPSRFAGFLAEGATFTANANATLSAEDIAQYKTVMKDFQETALEEMSNEGDMSEAELAIAKDLVGEIFAVLDGTMDAGKMDMGANVIMNDDSTNMAVGMTTANPASLEAKIKDLVEKMRAEIGDEAEINLNFETFNDVRLHEVIVSVPEDEEELVNLVGDTAKIYIGFGNDVIYLAAGSDPLDNLKSSMTRSGDDADNLPMQYNLFLAPLLKKIAAIEGEDMMGQMADKLTASGRDRIRFTTKSVTKGLDMSFEIEDGILELLGLVGAQFGGMGADF